MLKRIALLLLGLGVLGFAGHSASGADEKKKEDKKAMNSSNEVAVIKTSEGEMVVHF